MKKIGIIGLGRFGQVLVDIMKDDFELYGWSRSDKGTIDGITIHADPKDVYNTCDTIIYSVAISAFEAVLANHVQYIQPHHTLVDVLSVKMYPKEVFEKHQLLESSNVILTHPMFGPDSIRENGGLENLPFIVDATHGEAGWFTQFIVEKGMKLIEMTAEEHDKHAAFSQGVTHLIGRLLDKIDMQPTEIDTVGAQKLLEIKDQTCNDSWDLFVNLQTKNPYTQDMREQLREAYESIDAMLQQR